MSTLQTVYIAQVPVPYCAEVSGQQCPHVHVHYLDDTDFCLIITSFVHVQQTAAKQMHNHPLQLRS